MTSLKLRSKGIQGIVSLVPSATEILYFLGLDEKIVGVTANCDYPEKTLEKEKVGTFGYPQIEKIISLKPDLILGDMSLHGKFIEKFKMEDIIFVDTTTKKVDDIFKLMEYLGKITGTLTKVQPAINILKESLAKLEQKQKKREKKVKVFYLMNTNPFITPGPQSCQYDALRLAGAKLLNLQPSNVYAKVEWQQIQEFDPEVIFFCGIEKGQEPPPKCKGCLSKKPICWRTVDDIITKEWYQLTAFQKKRLYPISCYTLCRPGPRLIKGIEKIHNLLVKEEGNVSF